MLKHVPIVRNHATLSFNAICPDCKQLCMMVTDEAMRNAPRRDSGSSLLLPVIMSVAHNCTIDTMHGDPKS